MKYTLSKRLSMSNRKSDLMFDSDVAFVAVTRIRSRNPDEERLFTSTSRANSRGSRVCRQDGPLICRAAVPLFAAHGETANSSFDTF